MSTTTTTKPRATRSRKAAEATEKATPEVTTEETPEEQGPKYAELAAKPPTEFNERMAEWLTEQTGVEITPKAAQIVTALRDEFRTSETGRELVESRKKVAAKRKADELAKKKAAAAKRIAELQAVLDAE
jgi:sulfur relay (sulfurtransferase) DsrC/TusE family protein